MTKPAMTTNAMIECYFCKASVLDLRYAERKDWDWFTGKLSQTVHICPKCQRSEWKAVEQLREKAGVKQ